MKIYFIGIGGIGMSALARYYLSQGHQVVGSDMKYSELIQELIDQGIKIKIGPPRKENISQKLDLIVYSAAVPQENPELKQARKLGIRTQKYSEALGDITRQYYTICVAGTHGKSTTTAMLSLILVKAGLNPTVILGTKLKEFGNSNFRSGGRPTHLKLPTSIHKSILLIEADEWQESFLNYSPDIITVTNIEREHLDYYKTFPNLIRAFKKFIYSISQSGILVLNRDDRVLARIKLDDLHNIKIFFYSKEQKEASLLKKILKVPGQHNVSNALAALSAARALKVKDETIFEALGNYQGAWRRFSSQKIQLKRKGQKKREIILVDDYAHHPTEIQATLQAARERFGKREIWVVFQPHQIARTRLLFSQFARSFKKADRVIIADIYRVIGRDDNCTPREKKNLTKKLARAIQRSFAKSMNKKKKSIYLGTKRAIQEYLMKELSGKEIVIIMGAGDIYNLAQKIKHFSKR